jgi:GT2 family glycosyltransferase
VTSRVSQSRALLITVNYKGEQSTLELLASLSRLNEFSSLDVIVVNNGSGQESLSQLRGAIESLPNVQLLTSATNRGYFGAAKFAYDHYLRQGRELPNWTIVCNHDVIIDDPEFLLKLFSQEWRSVGVLAPRVRLAETGADQNPFMRHRPGWFRRASLRLVYSNYSFACLWDWLSYKKRALNQRINSISSRRVFTRENIYAAHGSCFMFSKQFFAAGGFFDDDLFLYGEEISVAEICRFLGLSIIFEPALNLLHNEHTSMGQAVSRFSYSCQKKALQHVTARYFSGSVQTTKRAKLDPSPANSE